VVISGKKWEKVDGNIGVTMLQVSNLLDKIGYFRPQNAIVYIKCLITVNKPIKTLKGLLLYPYILFFLLHLYSWL
jgi:hypothetical protein